MALGASCVGTLSRVLSVELKAQVAELTERLTGLREEVDELEASAASLSDALDEAGRERTRRRQEIADLRSRIAECEHQVLLEAEREEARARYDEAALAVCEAISHLLIKFGEYSVAESELVSLDDEWEGHEPDAVRKSWEALQEVVRATTGFESADPGDTAASDRFRHLIAALPGHLREASVEAGDEDPDGRL